MRYVIFQFAICFFSFAMQAQVIQTTISTAQLNCLEKGEDNYIVYKNDTGTDFSFYIKTDYCGLLKLKMQHSIVNITGNVCINTNGRMVDLGLDESYTVMFPISVSYETDSPNVVIIEMDMVNFVSTRGYTYLVIDMRDRGIIRYAKFSEKLLVKNLKPAFKKYKELKYPVITINRS
jgi:hypothetical protein